MNWIGYPLYISIEALRAFSTASEFNAEQYNHKTLFGCDKYKTMYNKYRNDHNKNFKVLNEISMEEHWTPAVSFTLCNPV